MSDSEDDFVPRSGSGGASDAALAAATSASREKADAYLDKHAALIDLQMQQVRLQNENLRQQDEYELSHLRWRRFNDQMAGAAQIMLVGLGMLIVVAVAAAIWNASQADGLVVDSFSVPPSFAASGMNGDVVADDITQKLAAIRGITNAHSLVSSKDVRQEHDKDIKVEIPQTGISLSEAWRYLRLWLGNERHLSGHLRSLPDGQIALNVSLGGADSFNFTGKPGDLDRLEDQAAERVFATVDPVNTVVYLDAKGREAESIEAAKHVIALGGNKGELADAYSLYSNMIRDIDGDVEQSLAEAKLALAIDPKTVPPHLEVMRSERLLGHDEAVLEQARLIADLHPEDNIGSWRTANGLGIVRQLASFYRAMETGDFAELLVQPCTTSTCSLSEAALRRAGDAARLHDPELSKASIAQALAAATASKNDLTQTGNVDKIQLARTKYYLDASLGHWDAAANDARNLSDAVMADEDYGVRNRTLQALTQVLPLLADALARSGDLRNARGTIEATPTDCYDCERVRGEIDALDHNSRHAAFWFARAVHDAPSIPFAYADWGAMLLRAGQYDDAIAKFKQANEKGPHFADPREMWGEALMLRNRSDLALAKFEEANKYAPNWGRLHLKWGEALFYAGKKDEAKKQIAAAATLDLSAADKVQLATMSARHGQ
jgi:tetratricopeptide (TPR) repeat protein